MEHNTSKLVDGYRTAFIDSGFQSDPEYSPQFLSNTKGRKVLVALEKELKTCDEMFMSVAFITKSGVEPLLGTLKELETKGVKGRILTTDYLMFSEPSALDTLNSLSNIELRMVKTADEHAGFHTKGYMFQKDDQLRIIVGSSNLTQGAITKNHEWNTKIVSTVKGRFAEDIEAEFNDLWSVSTSYEEYREEYAATYKNKADERKALKNICGKLVSGYGKVLQPNAMQEQFVANIENFISMGRTRALLISATGTGKTYASAFAIRNIFDKCIFRKQKVLFLSHREQINKQAQKSYSAVFGDTIRTELLSGTHNNLHLAHSADFLFSTMQMMAKSDIRESFSPSEFSVIILDECHRSGAKSYQDIIDYFKPSLLLGMSASPERTDDFDVFNLFDHNIACEIRLQQALENDMLCPFHYFGITDLEIEGEQSDYETFNQLISDNRVNHIIKNAEYYGHSGERVMGLVFCSSKNEARELSCKFNESGKYRTIALSGDDSQEKREAAIAKLTASDGDCLDYIFTVDIFNEGVDIPEINQIIMLRQTESPIVFVQQLGRGLRKAENKEFVVILDFIGNYENNYMIPIALSGDRTGNKDNIRRSLMEGNNFIQGASTIYFDEISKKRIYASIDTAKLNKIAILKKEYQNLKYKLGGIPHLKDFDSFGELDPLRIISASGAYYNFLEKYDTDFCVRLNAVQKEMLEFISTKFASGKRPHELEFISLLLSGSADLMAEWENLMLQKYNISLDECAKTNVVNVLTNVFWSVGAAKDSYRNCVFISTNAQGKLCVSGEFRQALSDGNFFNMVKEVVDFGLARNRRDYIGAHNDTSLVINKKYTYEDVCRLLNWEKNQVATNIGGYKYDEKTKTYPVFINYHKSENISDTTRYEDRFENPSNLIAISKSNRTLASPDVDMALHSVERGVRMHLFIRKNKDDQESKEFYYLGEMRHNGFRHGFTMANTNASAVEIGYTLRQPVAPDLYEYITETEI